MTTADELGRALDVMYPDGDAPALFTGYDEGWCLRERPIEDERPRELEAAFIGLAVPWLGERGYSYVYCERGNGDTEHCWGPNHRSESMFDATVSAVLAEGASDE